MRENRADEITQFKANINLAEYAASRGYELDRRESSRSSAVLRGPGDDKLIVATDQDGHGVYFSVRDDADNGSIIDFIQRRQGLNLGQVRRELRPWIGVGSMPVPERSRIQKPAPSTADQRQVIAKYVAMDAPASHSYLEQRGIAAATQRDARFAGSFRADARGNAVFPHWSEDGLVGYELKNEGFTGFAAGGQKAIWHSMNLDRAERVVVVESAIDAMSHAQVTGDTDAAYISIGGQMSDHQRSELGVKISAAHERGATIEVATDSDEAGQKLGQKVAEVVPVGAKLEERKPKHKDWNDELQYQERDASQRQGPKTDLGHGM